MDQFTGFVIAAQFGDPHTGADDGVWKLKAIVERRMSATRIAGLESVHLVFRVDGRFAVYRCAKAEKLRIAKKYRMASVDLGVPVSAYGGRSGSEVRLYLCECVEAALELLVARARKEKICEGCELLYGDWQGAKAEFLSLK